MTQTLSTGNLAERLLDIFQPAPDRILDLGAHFGQTAMFMRTLFPLSHVTSVEANEACLDTLEHWAHEVHHAVLWDRDNQEVAFWHRKDDAPGGSTGNSCFRENTQFFSDLERDKGNVWCETRQTITLDSLLADEPPFQLVKLDLQGAELRAIQGGEGIIRQADAVLCEQQRVEYNCGAPMAHEVDAAIRHLGFRLVWESDETSQGAFQVDRLYVRHGSEIDVRMRLESQFREGVREEEAV